MLRLNLFNVVHFLIYQLLIIILYIIKYILMLKLIFNVELIQFNYLFIFLNEIKYINKPVNYCK